MEKWKEEFDKNEKWCWLFQNGNHIFYQKAGKEIKAFIEKVSNERYKEGYIQGGIDEINKVVNILSDQNNVTPSSNDAG